MAQLIVKSSSFNDVIITGPNFTGSGNLVVTGSLILTGSLRSTGSVNLTLTNPSTTVSDLLIISSSGQIFSTASTAFSTTFKTPPASPINSIQYNSGSAFGGDSNFILEQVSDGRGGFYPALRFGPNTTSSGFYSVAFGENAKAREAYSLAIGQGTETRGASSLAMGNFTSTSPNASYSSVSGYYTVASASYQNVVGQFNTQGNTTDFFVVGAGVNGIRVDGLGVNNQRTYISNSVYLPNLTNALQDKIVMINSAGQLFYAASQSIKVTSASYAVSASWSPNSTPSLPDGPYRSIQFNSGSKFSGSGNLIFDENNNFIFDGGTSTISNNGGYTYLLAGIGLTGDTYYSSVNEGAIVLGSCNIPNDLNISRNVNRFIVGNGIYGYSNENAIEVGTNYDTGIPYINLPQLSTDDISSNNIVTINPSSGQLYKSTTLHSITLNSSSVSGDIVLNPSDPLPTGQLGSLAVSGSSLWFHNGSTWKEVNLL